MKTTETPTPARRRSPIFWVPTAYFGMGLPFVVLNMVAVLMYKAHPLKRVAMRCG